MTCLRAQPYSVPVAATSPEILLEQQRGRPDVTRRSHIAALTGLRGFAALVVLISHCAGVSAYPWLGFPTYGPIALFVLSGYLLFQPWSRWYLGMGPRPSVRDFVRRRSWRILPPYLALVALLWVLLPPSRPTSWQGLLRTVTLTHIYVPGDLRTGLHHTWSLGTEASWYVVLPITAALVGLALRSGRLTPGAAVAGLVVSMLVLTAGWRLVAYQTDDAAARIVFPMLFPSFAICFFAGAALSHLHTHDTGRQTRTRIMSSLSRFPALTLVVSLGAGLVGASKLGGPWGFVESTLSESSLRAASMLLMALLLLGGVVSSSGRNVYTGIFGNRPAVAVGRWSYGIYLWHFPVLTVLLREMGIPDSGLELISLIALTMAISVPLGAVTYAFIERPAIAHSKRNTSPDRARRARLRVL